MHKILTCKGIIYITLKVNIKNCKSLQVHNKKIKYNLQFDLTILASQIPASMALLATRRKTCPPSIKIKVLLQVK